MKKNVVLSFVLFAMLPNVVFAECVDYAKVVIGFSMLFFFSLFFLLALIFLMYWILGGRKHIKLFVVLTAFSFMFGMFSVVVGLVKEHGGDNVTFLHKQNCEE